jgi:hypothetical protein
MRQIKRPVPLDATQGVSKPVLVPGERHLMLNLLQFEALAKLN